MTDPASEVQAWMDERADEMAELLTRLIACRSRIRLGAALPSAPQCCARRRAAIPSPEVIEIEPTGSI